MTNESDIRHLFGAVGLFFL